MLAIRALFAARWFPYALILVPSVAAIVFGLGYTKGYDSAEARMHQQMAEALRRQAARLTDAERKRLTAEHRLENELDSIASISDCRDPEWLHSFNAGVRAARRAAGDN